MRAFLPVTLLLTVAGCSNPGGPYPSLAPRAAEAIDPRVPVIKPMNDRPVDAALAAKLASLVNEARSGEAAFDAAASRAQQLAAMAGVPQSESWTAAQEALSAAVSAHEPTARALADIDALGADKLQGQRGLAPNDLAAIQQAGEQVGAIDQRQVRSLKAIQQRLGQ